MKKYIFALAMALFSVAAFAQHIPIQPTFLGDWYDPAEPGWGIDLRQHLSMLEDGGTIVNFVKVYGIGDDMREWAVAQFGPEARKFGVYTFPLYQGTLGNVTEIGAGELRYDRDNRSWLFSYAVTIDGKDFAADDVGLYQLTKPVGDDGSVYWCVRGAMFPRPYPQFPEDSFYCD